MSIKRLTAPLAFFILATALLSLSSCNSSSDPFDEPYDRGTELIVTKFYLKADYKVMTNLDSVYFAIDLNHRVIYNADSLPVGTPVDKLVPMLTIPSTVGQVQIVVENPETGESTVHDYRENPGDTIDFTRRVTLRLANLDGTVDRSYALRVNVHKMNPDSLFFDMNARMALPARLDNPAAQKAVSRDSTVYCLIQENDGSYTLSHTRRIEAGTWTRHAVMPGFTPDVRSLTATDDAFYLLSTSGQLYRSADGLDWRQLTEAGRWTSIIGAFNNAVQGVREANGQLVHTQYPMGTYAETPLEPGFPYLHSSDMSIYSTKWSSLPLGLITGGYDGTNYTGETWAFDGTTWVDISNRGLPAIYGGVMVPYYAYLRTSTLWLFNEYSVWLYIGGALGDGTPNHTVYISYDNGVHWQEAPQAMQLPADFPAIFEVDHAVLDTPLEANFSPEAWTDINGKRTFGGQRRLPYVINGYRISWNCPYIYLVGGSSEPGAALSPWIYRGVINRMSFKPLI